MPLGFITLDAPVMALQCQSRPGFFWVGLENQESKLFALKSSFVSDYVFSWMKRDAGIQFNAQGILAVF